MIKSYAHVVLKMIHFTISLILTVIIHLKVSDMCCGSVSKAGPNFFGLS